MSARTQRSVLLALADLAADDGWVDVDSAALAVALGLPESVVLDAVFELFLAAHLDLVEGSESGFRLSRVRADVLVGGSI